MHPQRFMNAARSIIDRCNELRSDWRQELCNWRHDPSCTDSTLDEIFRSTARGLFNLERLCSALNEIESAEELTIEDYDRVCEAVKSTFNKMYDYSGMSSFDYDECTGRVRYWYATGFAGTWCWTYQAASGGPTLTFRCPGRPDIVVTVK